MRVPQSCRITGVDQGELSPFKMRATICAQEHTMAELRWRLCDVHDTVHQELLVKMRATIEEIRVGGFQRVPAELACITDCLARRSRTLNP